MRRPWDEPEPPQLRLVGNLPFNISSPLCMRLVRSVSKRDNLFSYGRVPMLLTFQHEVANRMVAPPGSLERSRLSIMCQNWTQTRYAYTLSGDAFLPPPKVDVGVVTMVPLRKPYIELPFHFVDKVVTTLFHGKRKHVRNTVRRLFPRSMDQEMLLRRMLDVAHVDDERWPLSLSMEEVAKLCYAYRQICDERPFLDKFIDREVEALMLTSMERRVGNAPALPPPMYGGDEEIGET